MAITYVMGGHVWAKCEVAVGITIVEVTSHDAKGIINYGGQFVYVVNTVIHATLKIFSTA